jgi:predicted glycosyltransferase
MLREAAYLGVPAISIFRSESGAVDRLLEQRGAVRFVTRVSDLDAVDWRVGSREPRVDHHPEILDELAELMAAVGRSAVAHRGLRA